MAHALYLEITRKVEVKDVKGHAGVEGNELADRMSVVAIERQEKDLSRYMDGLSVEELLGLARR